MMKARTQNSKTILRYKTIFTSLSFVLTALIISCSDDDGLQPWETEVEKLKTAVERFKDIDVAKAEGYDVDVTGYRTGMGHHFLKATLLDNTFEITKPEVLLYVPNGSGDMDLVAVEYGIPIVDLDNPPPPPEGFSGDADVWEISNEFSLWTLHAWVVLNNPEGIFAPMNPRLP